MCFYYKYILQNSILKAVLLACSLQMSCRIEEMMLLITKVNTQLLLSLIEMCVFHLLLSEFILSKCTLKSVSNKSVRDRSEFSVLDSYLINDDGFSLVWQTWLLFVNVMELSMTHDLTIT